jgi:mono/diheme cytochrome c family protein
MVGLWKRLNFEPGPLPDDPARPAAWNRGRYLARAVAHCEECHTPRGWLGALRDDLFLAGTAEGPEGELAPNITPDPRTGIGDWDEADLAWFLETGLKPDGDDTQGLMYEVIEHGYRHMTADDRRALAVYLRSVPPVRNRVQARPRPQGQ